MTRRIRKSRQPQRGRYAVQQHMSRTRVAIITATATLVSVAGLATACAPDTEPAKAGIMPQSEFPCHEDEVLGYDPAYGSDHVGCIHVEGDMLERP